MNDNEEIETLDELETEEVPKAPEVVPEEKTPEVAPVEEPKAEEPKPTPAHTPTEEPKVEEPKQEEPPKKEEKKKKKKILPIILIIILLIAIGGVIFFIFNKNNKKESPTNSNGIIISFNTSGGSEIKEISINENEEVSLPTPSKKGFTFQGWYDGGQKVESKSKFSKNTVLLAKWEKKEDKKVFKITFSPATNVNSLEFPCGMPIFNLDELVKSPEDNNYSFRGWRNKKNGIMHQYGSVYECEDTTLEATWEERKIYLTFFDSAKRGNVKDFIELETSMKCEDNMTLKLPDKAPTIEGYEFKKWIYYDYPKEKAGQEAHNGDKLVCENYEFGAIYLPVHNKPTEPEVVQKPIEPTPEEPEDPTPIEPEEPENEDN